MARPPKVPNGSTRTVLLREDQIRHLTEVARGTAVDFSDAVRGAVDLLYPLHPDAARAKTRAAVELQWREVADRPELVRAIGQGLRGQEMTLPLGSAIRHDARLVQAIVDAITMLKLPPPAGKDPQADGSYLPADWATTSPDRLLVVLAAPGTIPARLSPDGRPLLVVVSRRIAPPRGDDPSAADPRESPAEAQYAGPARALCELLAHYEVDDVTHRIFGPKADVPLADLLGWAAYEIRGGPRDSDLQPEPPDPVVRPETRKKRADKPPG